MDNVTKMLEHALVKQLGQLGAIGDPRERLIDGKPTQAQALELGYLLLKLAQLAPALDSPSFNGLLWGLADHLAVILMDSGLAPPRALLAALQACRSG
ncbi:MAG: hypothetical protein U1A78_32055 [Polyangia bacterium]